MKKKDQGGAKTSKQLSDPVFLIDTTEYITYSITFFAIHFCQRSKEANLG